MASVLQKIKSKIIDKSSDVLSIVPRMRANRVMRQAASDVDLVKADRASGGNVIAPNANDPKWQTRSLANDVRYRRGASMK